MASLFKLIELEHSHVSPPPGLIPATSLPLTFFDTFWVSCRPNQRLFFFEFPYPTSNFMQNHLPNLKNSLSFVLQRFFPFAGNLRLPSPPQRPYIYYADGDSVPLVVTESTADNFKHLTDTVTGNDHQIPRRRHELEDLVPKLAPPTMCSDKDNLYKQQPLMAIQVTIFPNSGISIGFTFCHAAADGKAFNHFIKSWASICRLDGDHLSSVNSLALPDYSRDLIQDPQGIWFIFLSKTSDILAKTTPFPADDVRITQVISQSQVEMLKNRIASKFAGHEEIPRLSTFGVTTAFMWICLAKLHYIKNELLRPDDGICIFAFQADCRDKLRLPPNYFGNCIRPCIVTAKGSELIGEDGIFLAAKAIGREIQEFEKEPLKGAENWISRGNQLFNECQHLLTVTGSPKLKVYETDFGFGRPTKTEVVHISSRSISMAESRDEEGGVEFGLVIASAELDIYSAVFKSMCDKSL